MPLLNFFALYRYIQKIPRAVMAVCLLGFCIFAGQTLGAQSRSPDIQAAQKQLLAQYWRQGNVDLQKSDNAGAAQNFRKALALAPQSIEVLNNLAISLARQGKDDEAIALYERALHLKPDDAVTRRNLGVAYFRAHRYKDALPYLEELSKSMPTFQAFELTGLDLFALDRYKHAIVYLEHASSLQPADIQTLDILGKAYWRVKDYSGVTKVFDRIMAVDPNSPEAHFMMGLAYDVLSKEDDARKEFQAVLAEDPKYPGVYSSLGLIDFRMQRTPQALDEFKKELSLYPNDPVSNYMVGQILRQQNQPAKAIPYLEAAVKVNPNYRDALMELGQCHILLNEPQKAIPPLKRVTEVDPDFAQAHFVLGTALSMAGQAADAKRERNISKKLDADDAARLRARIARREQNPPSH